MRIGPKSNVWPLIDISLNEKGFIPIFDSVVPFQPQLTICWLIKIFQKLLGKISVSKVSIFVVLL